MVRTAAIAGVGVLRAQREQDLNLLAGQLWFGHEARSVRTLLGSCVAVTLWHPGRRIGGMCHYLLPQRHRPAVAPRDARFGDEALEMLVEALLRAGTQPQEYEAHLYGGADTMPDRAGVKLNIGERNIEQGWTLIDHYGFSLMGVDVGEHIPRNLKLTLATGEVLMRRGELAGKAAAGAGA
jgi:chemotaxis protein CheD